MHLDRAGGIGYREDRLSFSDSGLERDVRGAICAVLGRTKVSRRSFIVPPTGASHRLLLCVLPAASADFTRALLFIEDPATLPGEPARTALAELYSLSAAEVSVALVLAQGEEVSAIADSRGVTRETVRTQGKQVYAKTGTGRQAALARLVAGLPTLGY